MLCGFRGFPWRFGEHLGVMKVFLQELDTVFFFARAEGSKAPQELQYHIWGVRSRKELAQERIFRYVLILALSDVP